MSLHHCKEDQLSKRHTPIAKRVMQDVLGVAAEVGSRTKLDAGRSLVQSSSVDGCSGHSLDLMLHDQDGSEIIQKQPYTIQTKVRTVYTCTGQFEASQSGKSRSQEPAEVLGQALRHPCRTPSSLGLLEKPGDDFAEPSEPKPYNMKIQAMYSQVSRPLRPPKLFRNISWTPGSSRRRQIGSIDIFLGPCLSHRPGSASPLLACCLGREPGEK